MTLFEALTSGAFDRLSWQHSGEFDQNLSKKSNARGFVRGGMGGFGIDRYINMADELQNTNQLLTSLGFSLLTTHLLSSFLLYILLSYMAFFPSPKNY